MRPRRTMSRELEAFLVTEDLDDLLRARLRLGTPSSGDVQTVVSVLEQWTDRQAVANLLFYPDLVLTTLRMRFLMRALDETEVPYYRLAAIVGLQKLVTNEFDEPEERKSVRDRLLTLIEQADEAIRAAGVPTLEGVIGDRASVVLPMYVERTDAPRLMRFLEHPSEAVRNNALRTLLEYFGTEEAVRRVDAAADAREVSPPTAEFVRRNAEKPPMLFAYIPNLVEIGPAQVMEGGTGRKSSLS